MTTFFVAILTLIAGYFTYGKVIERIFGPTEAPTPANTMNDGVDYVPISTSTAFLIHLLNIAGLGPIVYFRIVLGSISPVPYTTLCALALPSV